MLPCRLHECRQFRAGRRQIFVAFDVHAQPAAAAQHQTAATVAAAIRTAEQIATGQPTQLLRCHRHNQSKILASASTPRTIRCLVGFMVFNCFLFLRLFQTERKEQHFTPGVFTCMKLPEDKQDECSQTSLYEISRNRLRVIEKLGEGNFGMVSVSDCTKPTPSHPINPPHKHPPTDRPREHTSHTRCRVTSRTRET